MISLKSTSLGMNLGVCSSQKIFWPPFPDSSVSPGFRSPCCALLGLFPTLLPCDHTVDVHAQVDRCHLSAAMTPTRQGSRFCYSRCQHAGRPVSNEGFIACSALPAPRRCIGDERSAPLGWLGRPHHSAMERKIPAFSEKPVPAKDRVWSCVRRNCNDIEGWE